MASMTPQQRFYWRRQLDQLSILLNMMEDSAPQAAQQIEYVRRLAYGNAMMSARERAAWDALYKLQGQFERFTRRVADSMRALANMVCLEEYVMAHQDTDPMPVAARVMERNVYTLSEYTRQRRTEGPLPSSGPAPSYGEYGEPASGTVPLSEEQRISGMPAPMPAEPIDTGHPMPHGLGYVGPQRAEMPAARPSVFRTYGNALHPDEEA